jgi:plasmid stability protein
MPTLYVENVPEELYEALRARARTRRNSISAEVIHLLEENVPTRQELARRQRLLKLATAISGRKAAAMGSFPAAEEMQREDRGR